MKSLDEQIEELRKQIAEVNLARQIQAIKSDVKPNLISFDIAAKKLIRRHYRVNGGTSKHRPHQGVRECARRRG